VIRGREGRRKEEGRKEGRSIYIYIYIYVFVYVWYAQVQVYSQRERENFNYNTWRGEVDKFRTYSTRAFINYPQVTACAVRGSP
jgi:hypothetical protein